MKIIGVTGPSGAGKTTVLERLAARDVPVIQADEIYHELLRTDSELKQKLAAVFPGAFPSPETLDRKALGRLVFSDAVARAELERITHPAVIGRVHSLLSRWADTGKRLAAVEAIALIESGFYEECDVVLAVLARHDLMTSRITVRDGVSLHYAASRLGAQRSDEFYCGHATHILRNDGDLDLLLRRTDEFLDKISTEERAEL